MRRSGVIGYQQINLAQNRHSLLEIRLARQNHCLFAHEARNFLRDIQFIIRTNQYDLCSQVSDESIGKSCISFGGPALGPAVDRSGAKRHDWSTLAIQVCLNTVTAKQLKRGAT